VNVFANVLRSMGVRRGRVAIYLPMIWAARSTLMSEGVPNYPNASRFWQVIDKHKVDIFYTAPKPG
jgi:acyl-coenzyme A synthetase/AMP-(fatty) acid ligase